MYYKYHKLIKKLYPNSSIIKELYPNGREYNGMWEVSHKTDTYYTVSSRSSPWLFEKYCEMVRKGELIEEKISYTGYVKLY